MGLFAKSGLSEGPSVSDERRHLHGTDHLTFSFSSHKDSLALPWGCQAPLQQRSLRSPRALWPWGRTAPLRRPLSAPRPAPPPAATWECPPLLEHWPAPETVNDTAVAFSRDRDTSKIVPEQTAKQGHFLCFPHIVKRLRERLFLLLLFGQLVVRTGQTQRFRLQNTTTCQLCLLSCLSFAFSVCIPEFTLLCTLRRNFTKHKSLSKPRPFGSLSFEQSISW